MPIHVTLHVDKEEVLFGAGLDHVLNIQLLLDCFCFEGERGRNAPRVKMKYCIPLEPFGFVATKKLDRSFCPEYSFGIRGSTLERAPHINENSEAFSTICNCSGGIFLASFFKFPLVDCVIGLLLF